MATTQIHTWRRTQGHPPVHNGTPGEQRLCAPATPFVPICRRRMRQEAPKKRVDISLGLQFALLIRSCSALVVGVPLLSDCRVFCLLVGPLTACGRMQTTKVTCHCFVVSPPLPFRTSRGEGARGVNCISELISDGSLAAIQFAKLNVSIILNSLPFTPVPATAQQGLEWNPSDVVRTSCQHQCIVGRMQATRRAECLSSTPIEDERHTRKRWPIH